MVTRKDLARYRAGGPIWRRSVHRLPVWRPLPPATATAARLPLHGVCRHTLARRLEARAELRRAREGAGMEREGAGVEREGVGVAREGTLERREATFVRSAEGGDMGTADDVPLVV